MEDTVKNTDMDTRAYYQMVVRNIADLYLKIMPKDRVDRELSNPHQQHPLGMTWLHVVCNEGFQDTVHLFIDREGSEKYINTPDYAGNTSISLACKQGYYYIVMILMEKGAVVDKLTHSSVLTFLSEMKYTLANMRWELNTAATPYYKKKILHSNIYHMQNNFNRLVTALNRSTMV